MIHRAAVRACSTGYGAAIGRSRATGYPAGVREWLTRAGLMMLLHVGVRTALGFAALSWPTSGQTQRIAGLVLVVVVAMAWAGLDGVRENVDDDQRGDLTVRWLKAAVLAGPVAGLAGWAVEGMFIDSTSTSTLGGDVVGGGAFTALLILVPAMIGLAFGRLARTDRRVLHRPINREPSV